MRSVEKKSVRIFWVTITKTNKPIFFFTLKNPTTQYTYEHEATQDHEVDYES